MNYPNWHKPNLTLRAQMHVQHYKARLAGNDLSIAGCGCRGCMLAWQKLIDRKADALEYQ